MISYRMRHCIRSAMVTALFAIGTLVIGTGIADSHGGKPHTGGSFAAFQAVQKAIQLYDQLIVSGKLPEAWETSLSSIYISFQGPENNRETVVQFKRDGGDPDSVYFFFNQRGDYSGSNFTGKQ